MPTREASAKRTSTATRFQGWSQPTRAFRREIAFGSAVTSAWTSHMVELHSQMQQAAIQHPGCRADFAFTRGTQVGPGRRQSLAANAGRHRLSMQTLGVSSPRASKALRFRLCPGTFEIWVADAGWKQSRDQQDRRATDGIVGTDWPCYREQVLQVRGAGLSLYARRMRSQYSRRLRHSRISIRSRWFLPLPGAAASAVSGIAFYTGTAC
jgi:hypothetical protein